MATCRLPAPNRSMPAAIMSERRRFATVAAVPAAAGDRTQARPAGSLVSPAAAWAARRAAAMKFAFAAGSAGAGFPKTASEAAIRLVADGARPPGAPDPG